MEIHSLLTKCALKVQEKLHSLMFEREEWQHVKNPIHCLVKEQWQHIEIHPLLAKCALTAQGKLHPLISEREQDSMWKIRHTTQFITVTRWKIIHCLLIVHWKHMENQIHWFLREDRQHPLLSETAVTTYGNPSTAYWMWCENTWKKTSIAAWNRAVTTCDKLIHCLVKQQEQHMWIHALLIKCAVTTHGK